MMERAGSRHPVEYRICWCANTNISFQGESDWEAWYEDGATCDEVSDALNSGGATLSEGLSMALEASGFEWWIEVRQAGDES